MNSFRSFTELTFVDEKNEVYVDIEHASGVILDVYVNCDTTLRDENHEDWEELKEFTWKKGVNPLSIHCDQPERMLSYLLENFDLTSGDIEQWQKLCEKHPHLKNL